MIQHQTGLDRLVFSAGHFITFGDNTCESLHGHDYRVAVEVEGPLSENQYVIDFCLLEKFVGEIISELDHRTLLPSKHPAIKVAADDKQVEARFADRRWVLPRADCVLLDMANTTSESLAHHIAAKLRASLRHAGALLTSIEVSINESPGRTAVCRLRVEG